ncbi:efflux RND transporter permease subunit [Lichenicoccus roseus]|uniref:Nodulation protein n=1 Tax=Lichenicoccus roseus TaxID=2683649 RepID=A0A5R9J781_9PROT|nr:efflux RND transporter permease subunit [Lichenicoccus roseus]TLU72703.1 nodulation protein [Lichenicoccus roseus]
MNISAPFISRPVATTLLTIAITLAGLLGYAKLPVSPLPQIDFPTIMVNAQLPGASPEVVATSLAAPLERHLGQIADVTEMTSQSQTGQVRITLQFGLSRDINGAARDVQAGINAAQADLPTNLLSQPTYRLVNPADAPILILALTSKTLTRGQMYDSASTVMQQQLSQLSGIGQVVISGAALPAVRVELDPLELFHYGIGLEDIRSALTNSNANTPKGSIDLGGHRWQIADNDQSNHADDYRPMVVAYRNGDAVRLSDVAQVTDSVQDVRNLGLADGKPAVLVILFRQPGANIISTIDGVRAAVPKLRAALPSDLDITFAIDRSTTIRASLADTQRTLIIAVLLVIAVVYVFLRSGRATLIPAIAVPVSIIGTFGVMYLFGYSLDNLSLMALTIATGFVVDDAIVVLENISRHLEDGMPRVQAALIGARDVGFTVVSITLSLIAVFLPILLMGGIVGRLFREFAVTLSVAILVSMLISLTTTPMMCALFLRPEKVREAAGTTALDRLRNRSLFQRVQDGYARVLAVALDHPVLVLLLLAGTVALNVWLLVVIPKGFFPEQDTGRLMGSLQADQSISFQLMSKKFTQMMSIVQHDPAVQDVVGTTGQGSGGASSQTNTATVYVSLKPLAQRDRMPQVLAGLRRELGHVPGGRLYMQAVQDIRVGGRQSNAAYQYTLLGDNSDEVNEWGPKLLAALQHGHVLVDVSSDQQQGGLETNIVVDRATASRLDLTMYQVDNTLYDAFGQRSVSTIYDAENQYHVVMEVAPQYWQRPSILGQIWISTSGAQASGSETTALSGGSVSAGSATGITTASVVSVPAVSASRSSSADGATNRSAVLTNNTVSLSIVASAAGSNGNSASSSASATSSSSGTTSNGTSSSSTSSSSTTGSSSSSSTAANNAVRTAAQASLTSTGNGSSSSASAVSTSAETMIPLSAVAHSIADHTPLAVNHQSQYVATTISFNLAPGKSLSDATDEIQKAVQSIRLPGDLTVGFAGTALTYQQSLKSEPILVLAALTAIYIVLGVLYESFIHPLTILSTIPSAGVGAVLALMLFGIPFTIIALIGMILLIGIVKKNAILMIDFALAAEREDGMDSREAIFQAAVLRFRPIMMTTCAALLGALPLCFSFGEGSELRQPLGISIVGGLIVSQALTLFTTPVVYLALDRLRLRGRRSDTRQLPAQ